MAMTTLERPEVPWAQKIAVERVLAERRRQDVKFPDDNCNSTTMDPGRKLAILGEEFGEVCKEVVERPSARIRLRTELVQVAAVALAWIESLEEETDAPE